jgi:hypothetical protein
MRQMRVHESMGPAVQRERLDRVSEASRDLNCLLDKTGSCHRDHVDSFQSISGVGRESGPGGSLFATWQGDTARGAVSTGFRGLAFGFNGAYWYATAAYR